MTSFAYAGTTLVVADFVNDEDQVDEVADGTKFLIVRIREGVGRQKLEVTLGEESPLSVIEDMVVDDPSLGLWCSFREVGVGGSLEGRGEGQEIGEDIRGGFWVHD